MTKQQFQQRIIETLRANGYVLGLTVKGDRIYLSGRQGIITVTEDLDIQLWKVARRWVTPIEELLYF